MGRVGEILVVCPQERDRHAARSGDFRVRFAGPDLDAAPVDTRALLEELAGLTADGVVGTKDRSALLAAQLAERRGLPGPSPGAIVSCQHKPSVPSDPAACRARRDARASPWWTDRRLSPRRGGRSRSSAGCRRRRAVSTTRPSSRRWPRTGEYRDEYAELAGLSGTRSRGFLVEELVSGDEVTLEGFVHEGRGDRHRRHRLGQVPGHELVRALRVPVGAAAPSAWTS